MNRICAVSLMVFLAWSLHGQDDPDLREIPVSGLPDGARILAYSVVETESANLLVTEVSSGDGIVGFYLFDYVEHALVARLVGPRMIPGDLTEPPTHQPVTRDLGAPGRRFWQARIAGLVDRRVQLVSAPSLAELRFAELASGSWQLTPAQNSPLTIHRLLLSADGSVQDQCILEPNITAAEDRMTTTGAWWVHPFGVPHLLVGMLATGPDGRREGGLRLYSERNEIVAAIASGMEVDLNRIPDLVTADLSGDGERELIFFATEPEASRPLAAYRFARREGGDRVIAFNLCSERMHGNDVANLQAALLRHGFSLGPHGLDGWYGPDTRAAVIRFQRAAGLPVTGVVDDEVRQALGLRDAARR